MVIPTTDQFDGDTACLIDRRRIDPDVVICATGYLHGLEPLVGHLGVLDERGVPRAAGEEPAAEGLRLIGFMSRPALIAFVARQSRRMAARITEELERSVRLDHGHPKIGSGFTANRLRSG